MSARKRARRPAATHRDRWYTLRLATLEQIARRIPRDAEEEEVRRRVGDHARVIEVFETTLGPDWARHAAAPLPPDREHCPKERPCGHFLCAYHLALERTRHGSLRLCNPGVPIDQQETCLYDWVRQNPDGVSFAEVGRHFALKRTRMCQLWQGLVTKINATGMLPPPVPKPAPLPARSRVERCSEMAKPEDYVVAKDHEAHMKPLEDGEITTRYAIHEIAQVLPCMSVAEFDALVADIKAHGQRETIKIYEGKVLDGRNRYLACLRAGVEPRVEQWVPKGDENPVDYVISLNLSRRNLSESQRAMVAAKLKPLYDREAQKRQFANLRHATEEMLEGCSGDEHGRAADLVGKRLDVSGASVLRGETVLERGVPQLVAMVEQGKASVSAAAVVAELPPSHQQRIVDSKNPARAVTKAAVRIKHRRQKERVAALVEQAPPVAVVYEETALTEAREMVATLPAAALLLSAIDALEARPQLVRDARELAEAFLHGRKPSREVVERVLGCA